MDGWILKDIDRCLKLRLQTKGKGIGRGWAPKPGLVAAVENKIKVEGALPHSPPRSVKILLHFQDLTELLCPQEADIKSTQKRKWEAVGIVLFVFFQKKGVYMGPDTLLTGCPDQLRAAVLLGDSHAGRSNF